MPEYNPTVMEHFLHPHNVGTLKDANAIGIVENPTCGDVVKLSLKIENNIVVDARVKTFGCVAAIASSSIMTEIVKNKKIDELQRVTNKNITDTLGGLPAEKLRCSVFAEQVIKSALDNYIKGDKIWLQKG